jgi:general secretion pathway protein D
MVWQIVGRKTTLKGLNQMTRTFLESLKFSNKLAPFTLAGLLLTGGTAFQDFTAQPLLAQAGVGNGNQQTNLNQLLDENRLGFQSRSGFSPGSSGNAGSRENQLKLNIAGEARQVGGLPFEQISAGDSGVMQARESYPVQIRTAQNQEVNYTVGEQPTFPQISGAFPGQSQDEPLSDRFQLKQLSSADFEATLKTVWQDQLQSVFSPDGRYARYSLANLSQRQMIMLVDRQTGLLTFEGDPVLLESWHRLMGQIDTAPSNTQTPNRESQVLVHPSVVDVDKLQQAAFKMQNRQDNALLPQDDDDLKGPVRIVQDPITGMLTIIGDGPDVDVIRRLIDQYNLETVRQSRKIESLPLRNAQAGSIAATIQELYDSNYRSIYGPAEVRANTINNTLVLVGQAAALEEIKRIVSEYDIEGDPEQISNFKSIRLKFLSAADAKSRLDLYFGQVAQGVGTGPDRLPVIPIVTIADYRSNIITIKGSQQSIQEAEKFLAQIDVDDTDSAFEIRVVKVYNRLAEELAIIVQDAINGQQVNAGQGFKGLQQLGAGQFQQAQGQGQLNPQQSYPGSRSLIMRDGADGEVVSSGILFDARVTADRDANTLIIAAPAKSLELIEKLVKELDRIPDIEVQMKIFNVVNGDALELLSTLQSLFGANQLQQQGLGGLGGGGIQNQLPLQSAGTSPGSSLANLRFGVDSRTNSILATGPVGELQVVEALLARLDEFRPNERVTRVYRLSNAPVLDVADTINEWLASRDQINEIDPRAIGDINQTNRRVVVVPEVNSNQLVIQARPEYLSEITEIIQALDRRPPMVKVKVLLAEVDLGRLEEFGIDLGVQDSILFDRGTAVGPGETILGGIGFPFNQAGIGNLNATARSTVAAQGLSNLGTGRTNSELGYGGLVLSAGSDSVNLLIRALQNKQCVRVLSKPHIMTMENLQGRVSIGSSVPRISGTTNTAFGITQDIVFQDVGVILEVTPRVSPDGMIVLAVTASKSAVGPEATGITIAIGQDGSPIRAPLIQQTEARTTLMARSGQTVVFSGLIQESKINQRRGVPILSDLPLIGPLFRFESDEATRSELLIIMTPYLVTDDDDVDTHNFEEMDRMHWCIEDVAEIYGNTNYQRYDGSEMGIPTIYPNADPTGIRFQSEAPIR